jgi:hypothetical protein
MSVDQSYVDARIEALKAQNEAALTRIEARLDVISERLNHIPQRAEAIGYAFGTAIAIIGVIVAVLAFGGDRFDAGVQVTAASVQQAVDAKTLSERNAQQIDALTRSIGQTTDNLGQVTRQLLEMQKLAPPNDAPSSRPTPSKGQ